MTRFFALVLAVGGLVLAMAPIQASAQATDGEYHVFATPDLTHAIIVSAVVADSPDVANIMVSADGVELWITEFNQSSPGGFTDYQRVPRPAHPVHYADQSIVYKGTSTIQDHRYATTLTVTRVGLDLYFFLGLNPTATYYRYIDACNKTDSIRPVPSGYNELSQ